MRPFEQQVRERAYYIWEGEGRVFGRADDHWLRAETELRGDRVSSPELIPAVAAEISLAPSPAKALKPKAGRAKGAAAEAVAETPTIAAATEKKARAAKPSTTKTSVAKPSVAKAGPAKSRAPRATAESSVSIH